MDIKIRNEIIRLKNAKEEYQNGYIMNLEELEEKIQRLDSQLERATSDVKRDIIERQKNFYTDRVQKMDANIDSTIKFIDRKIEALEQKLKEINDEKGSFEYNFEKLKKALERRDVNEIFDMFEYVTNALAVLKKSSS